MKLGSETINRKINLVENCAINISFIFCQRQQQGELNSAVRQTTWGYSFHPSYTHTNVPGVSCQCFDLGKARSV